LAKDGRQNVYATHESGIILDGLEVDGKVKVGAEQYAEDEEHGHLSRPDDTHPEHRERRHSIVALAVLPHQEDSKSDCGSNE
jgi:hypothetical protein